MIRIQKKKQKGKIVQIKFQGHALYDDYGKDIVCAGVSAILTTSVNAVLKINEKALTYHQKKDEFLIEIHHFDKITNLLIQNMIDLLKELEEQYPQNLKVESEEEEC